MGDGAASRQQQLKDFALPVSVENETKSWAFLATRAQLLLNAYTTTVEVYVHVVVIWWNQIENSNFIAQF